MTGIEGLIIGLVILYQVLRWLFLTLRKATAAARQAFAPKRVVTVNEARQAAMEQTRRSEPSQPQRAQRPRRPEAGGTAVTDAAGSAQFRTQIARLEAQEAAGHQAPAATGVTSKAPPALFGSRGDLVRAIILQEALSKPLSQRRRAMLRPQHKTPPQP